MRSDLTTLEAAALLAERGIMVQAATVQKWCERGKLLGAYKVGGARGPWLIPCASVEGFQPRGPGWQLGRSRKPLKQQA